MSMDYYVYIKDPDAFSNLAFEKYCMSLGFSVKLHPELNLLLDEGFVPVCLTDDRFVQNGSNRFMTGFESYPSPYQPVVQNTPKAHGLFGLFSKKPKEETPFEKKVKDSSFVFALSCSGMDSFEPVIAHLLGAFCIRNCGGIFDDPQFGRYYDDAEELEQEIAFAVDDLLAEAEKGNLRTHPFEGWL